MICVEELHEAEGGGRRAWRSRSLGERWQLWRKGSSAALNISRTLDWQFRALQNHIVCGIDLLEGTSILP